jgi:hypothetical protein
MIEQQQIIPIYKPFRLPLQLRLLVPVFLTEGERQEIRERISYIDRANRTYVHEACVQAGLEKLDRDAMEMKERDERLLEACMKARTAPKPRPSIQIIYGGQRIRMPLLGNHEEKGE